MTRILRSLENSNVIKKFKEVVILIPSFNILLRMISTIMYTEFNINEKSRDVDVLAQGTDNATKPPPLCQDLNDIHSCQVMFDY